MPRKRRVKESPATDPVPFAEVLAASPALEAVLAAREAKAQIEPERAMPEPETDGSEAALAFKRQREREQAVAELPPPEKEVVASPERPVRRSFKWADTVRGVENPDTSAGVHHITAKIPIGDHGVMEVVGIKFDKGKHRTEDEKREMEGIDLTFRRDLEAWVKQYSPAAFGETQRMVRDFAQQRREQAEAERAR